MVVLNVLYFILLYLIGNIIINKFNFPFRYSVVIGYIVFLSCFQIITLPVMLSQGHFNNILLAFGVVVLISLILIFYFRKDLKIKVKPESKFEFCFTVISTIILILLMVIYNNNGNVADDFFYKSLYLDNLSSNSIFTFSPKEGMLFETFPYMYKINSFDLIPSVLAKLSGGHSTFIVMWIIVPFHYVLFNLTIFELLRVMKKSKFIIIAILGVFFFNNFYILDQQMGDAFSPALPSTYITYLMYSGKFVYFYILTPMIYILLLLKYKFEKSNTFWLLHLIVVASVSLNTTSVYLNIFIVSALIYIQIFCLDKKIDKKLIGLLLHLLIWAFLVLYLRFQVMVGVGVIALICLTLIAIIWWINNKSLKVLKILLIIAIIAINITGIFLSFISTLKILGFDAFCIKLWTAFNQYPILYSAWFIVLLYILLSRKVKSSETIVFALIPLMLLGLFFNPFASGIISLITSTYTYNRILWLVPIIFTVCIYIPDVLRLCLVNIKVNNKKIQIFVIILTFGIIIFSNQEWLYDKYYWKNYYNKEELNFRYDIAHDIVELSNYFEGLDKEPNVLPIPYEVYFNLRKLTASANYILDADTFLGKKVTDSMMIELLENVEKNIINPELWSDVIQNRELDYIILEKSNEQIYYFEGLGYEHFECGRYTVIKIGEDN